jgi:hypothetical protein
LGASARHVLIIGAAAALLAACGALRQAQGDMQPPSGTPGAILQTRAVATGADRRGSWMLPDATRIKKLLYISDGATNSVFVYKYDTGSFVGQLNGLKKPYGQCVDRGGNVWVTDLVGETIVKYPRGTIHWKEKMQTGGSPVGCSVDPTTGNVAVANVKTAGGGGSIRVFSPSGFKDYSNGECYYLEQPGYDSAGNLYVEAYSASYAVNVCGLPRGGATLAPVSVNQRIFGPGSAMWDGRYFTLTDEFYNDGPSTATYQVEVAPSGALTVVGVTVLTDNCDGNNAEVWQPFIVGKRNTPANRTQGDGLVGFDTDCQQEQRSSLWPYPAGGPPIRRRDHQPAEPEGNAVSIATR